MGEKGLVKEMQGDKLVVQMTRTEACAKCRACKVGLTSKEMIITAKNLCGANINDLVNIELQSQDFLLAVVISYGLPCLMMLIGFGAGYAAASCLSGFSPELAGFMLGIILMCLTYLWIRKKESYWKSKNFVPAATKLWDEE